MPFWSVWGITVKVLLLFYVRNNKEISFHSILFYAKLFYSIPFHSILFYILLTILFYSIPFYSILSYYIVTLDGLCRAREVRPYLPQHVFRIHHLS